MRFRCLNCGNTKRFYIFWSGEVGILHDRHLDERSTEYPFNYANPNDRESARLLLTTPTFSIADDACLSEVTCAICNRSSERIRWRKAGRSLPVPIGETSEDLRAYISEN